MTLGRGKLYLYNPVTGDQKELGPYRIEYPDLEKPEWPEEKVYKTETPLPSVTITLPFSKPMTKRRLEALRNSVFGGSDDA